MNYKIINNLPLLESFLDWLPDLEENETFYCSLFARKKYSPEMTQSNDRTQLKRFTSNKERLIQKLGQLELPLGRWRLKDREVPQEALVAYIMPNPRCMKKATERLGKQCWELMRSKNYNIHAEALSCVQKSKSRTVYVDFDIDDKEFELSDIPLPRDCYDILETRGGFHILVNPEKATKANKLWYPQLATFADNVGDQMIPIPGCVQSDFTPRFL